MIEKRGQSRMLCADLVEVRWKDPSGHNHRAIANLEDISTSGVCLQMDAEIALMTSVRITYPTGEYTGVVRYCQFKDDLGHLVGVQFEEGCEWSRASFEPSHLLDLRELTKGTAKGTKSSS